MAAHLKNRAITQRDNAAAAETAARARLDAAQQKRRLRVLDPTTVALDQWRDQMGAEQYLAETIARDGALQAAEATIRASLAAIQTPANHTALVAQLEANLKAQAQARVMRRDAQELDAISTSQLAALSGAVEAVAAVRAADDAWVSEADGLQTAIDAEKATLAAAPLATVANGAATLKASAAFTAAKNRLGALLPTQLADRAAQRFDEARAVVTTETKVLAAAQAERDDLDRARSPVDADVAIAARALIAARAALRDYIVGSPDRLARARAMIARVTALPALSADETAALDPTAASRAQAIAAVGLEKDFADSWQAYVDKDVVVKVALLDALKDDPDADPTADATVTAAIADRDAPAVAGALATATNAYTTALADELDAWEREVPIGLWEAARDLRRITVWLDRLADPATRTDLVNTLDAATEQVAAAHDEQAVLRRATARIASELGLEAGRIDAISSSSNERELAYVRGDGRGGRHADES